MEANATLVAGSHNRNELIILRRERDNDSMPKGVKGQIFHICQICGDDVGLNVDGKLFNACDECAFPICRTCNEFRLWKLAEIDVCGLNSGAYVF